MTRTSPTTVTLAVVAVVALVSTACAGLTGERHGSDAVVEVLDVEPATRGAPADFDEWTSADVCGAVPAESLEQTTEIDVLGISPFAAGAPQCSYVLDAPADTEVVVGVLRPTADLDELSGEAALLHAAARHAPSIGEPAETEVREIARGALVVRGPLTHMVFVLVEATVVTVASDDLDAMTMRLVAERVADHL